MTAAGEPFLVHQLERLKHSKRLESTIVATTTNPDDNQIVELCQQRGYSVFRGSEDDVLDRYYQTAKQFGVDPIVRITADCPLIDPAVVDKVIKKFQGGGFDHVGNGLPPTYPDGLDAEIFSFGALERAWKEAKLPSEREHVSSYIWNHPELFTYGNVEHEVDLSHLRWTIDYPEDRELLTKILVALYQPGKVFYLPDVIAYLDSHSELYRVNAKYARNEGFAKSLKEDEKATGKKAKRTSRQRQLQGERS